MGGSEEPGAYTQAMRRGFAFAHELASECGPVHFLVGIADGDEPLRAVLVGADGQSLRSVVAAHPGDLGRGARYLQLQAQGAARDLAAGRGRRVLAEHLLIAVLDQAEPRVVEALRRAGVDAPRARSAALRAIGAPADQPRIPLPLLNPAGTLDRPPLPLSALPAGAWAALRARQDRLPLSHLHRRSDWYAIISNEQRAVDRIVSRYGMDADQAYSLAYHHRVAVMIRAHEAAPGVVCPRREPTEPSTAHAAVVSRGSLPWTFRHPRLGGWACWFGNRRVDVRAVWLRLTVQH